MAIDEDPTVANNVHILVRVSGMFTDIKVFFIDDRLSGARKRAMTKPGKEIAVIFNDSDILIDITHKVRFGDMDSPFHVLTNQAD